MAFRTVFVAIMLWVSLAAAEPVTKISGCWTVRSEDQGSGVRSGAAGFEFPDKVCLAGKVTVNRDEAYDLRLTRLKPQSGAPEYSETVREQEIEKREDSSSLSFRILMSHETRWNQDIGGYNQETKHYLVLEVDLETDEVKAAAEKLFRWLPPLNDHRVESTPGKWQRAIPLVLNKAD
ncbi:MAG: hypothetical protein V1495_01910 [Pseudomonadota bacterium]